MALIVHLTRIYSPLAECLDHIIMRSYFTPFHFLQAFLYFLNEPLFVFKEAAYCLIDYP